jgi:hypothetical protein
MKVRMVRISGPGGAGGCCGVVVSEAESVEGSFGMASFRGDAGCGVSLGDG